MLLWENRNELFGQPNIRIHSFSLALTSTLFSYVDHCDDLFIALKFLPTYLGRHEKPKGSI